MRLILLLWLALAAAAFAVEGTGGGSHPRTAGVAGPPGVGGDRPPRAASAATVRPEQAPPYHRARPPALARLPKSGAEPSLVLPPPDPAAIARARAAASRAGERRRLVGLTRRLPGPGVPLAFQPVPDHDGSVLWHAAVAAPGYRRVRLGLWVEGLSAEDRLWVRDGAHWHPVTPAPGAGDGRRWTPSAAGGQLALAVRRSGALRALAPRVVVDAYGELLADAGEAKDLSCVEDAQCFDEADFPALAMAEQAVAHLVFEVDRAWFQCSGGLLADTNPHHTVFYLLTANHCFATQGAAATLEATFDFHRDGCGGPTPAWSALPRTVGSSLLATSTVGDVTLVRLSGRPGGERSLLGWTARRDDVAPGTVLHRISHPEGAPASYARSQVVEAPAVCLGVAPPDYLYQSLLIGSTARGSSGSPLMLEDGRVVGQLFGACGPNPSDNCDPGNQDLDGALGTTIGTIGPWLEDTVAHFDLEAIDVVLLADPADPLSIVTAPQPGQPLFARGRFALAGEGQVHTTVATVSLDGEALCSETGPIEAGPRTLLCGEVPVALGAGRYRLELVLDPADVIEETGETNNRAWRDIDVVPGPNAPAPLFADGFEA